MIYNASNFAFIIFIKKERKKYLTTDVKHVTVALKVVTGRPRERLGLRQIGDIPREATRVVDQATKAAQVGVLPPGPRALTGEITLGQAHGGRALL